jgi:hypothetical protein
MMPKVYTASSWRNQHYPDDVKAIHEAGFPLYDFRAANGGFHWSCRTYEEYIRELETDPAVAAAFQRDKDGLDSCDVCVLILPCGVSAHLELMHVSDAGKPVIVKLDPVEPLKPELMYKLLAVGSGGVQFVTSTEELIAALQEIATTNNTRDLTEQAVRDEMEKAHRLMEAGYFDMLEKVVDNEIDIDTAMQIFDGRRPNG